MIKVCSSDKYGREVWNDVHIEPTLSNVLGGIAVLIIFALIAVGYLCACVVIGRAL